ncbi:LOW QUALITY PROTEIN: leucine-rich repeat-containing protein 25 [Podargus strigoides]
MGHPAPPLLLLLLLPAAPTSPCFPVAPDSPAELNLTQSTQQCPELDWGLFQRQSRLWLSRDGIEALSPSSRVGPALEELDLSHNLLRELPHAFLSHARGLRHLGLQHNLLRALPAAFFANATALRSLRLEGNPLPAVPPTAFQPTLRLLAVPCRCDVVGSVLVPCACSGCAAGPPLCHCVTAHRDLFNVTDFHARQCRGSVGLVAGVAGGVGVVAVLVVVAAVVCHQRRRAATAAAGVGWGKWEPAAAHGQPRYVSRATETGTGDGTAAPDYENIFVTPGTAPAAAQGWTPAWPEEQPQVPADDDYFLESEATPGDQPIYANTQSPGEDNLYIIPDQ